MSSEPAYQDHVDAVDAYLDEEPEYGGYEHHLDRGDERWDAPWWKGWLVVLALIVIYLLWTGTIYFLEPGIR